MEQLILLLTVMIALHTLVAVSLFPYFWQRLLFAGVSACCTWWIYPLAIEQNKLFLQQIFAEKVDYLNAGALLMMEGIGLIAIRSLQLRQYFNALTGWWNKHPQIIRYLLFIPGLGYFAALYYGEVKLFLSIDQLPFEQLSLIYACLIGAITCLLPTLVDFLLPEKDLRLELDCFLLALQSLLAMVLAALPGINEYSHPTDGAKWPALPLLAWLCLLSLGVVIGYIQYWKKIKKKNK